MQCNCGSSVLASHCHQAMGHEPGCWQACSTCSQAFAVLRLLLIHSKRYTRVAFQSQAATQWQAAAQSPGEWSWFPMKAHDPFHYVGWLPIYMGRGHDVHGAQNRSQRQNLQAGQQPRLPGAWRHCRPDVASEVKICQIPQSNPHEFQPKQ